MNDRDPSLPAVVQLDSATIDQVAERVAELLSQRIAAPETVRGAVEPGLLSAAEVSRWWGVDRSWVYDHADQLGAIRLGNGKRPRLRFDPDRVAQALNPPADRPDVSRSPSIVADSPTLLPFHQQQSYGRRRP
jgi:hypothetical protein